VRPHPLILRAAVPASASSSMMSRGSCGPHPHPHPWLLILYPNPFSNPQGPLLPAAAWRGRGAVALGAHGACWKEAGGWPWGVGARGVAAGCWTVWKQM